MWKIQCNADFNFFWGEGAEDIRVFKVRRSMPRYVVVKACEPCDGDKRPFLFGFQLKRPGRKLASWRKNTASFWREPQSPCKEGSVVNAGSKKLFR